MRFSPVGFVMGAALAQKVDNPQKKSEIEVLGGMLGSTPMGIVVLATLAQQAETPTDTTPSKPAAPTESVVPDVTDSDNGTPAKILETSGLKLGRTEPVISSAPISTPISSQPPAGTYVALGSTVTLIVSAGLPVPDVVGLTLRAAADALAPYFEEVHDTLDAESFEYDDHDAIVAEQTPVAGTLASSGSQVELIVRATG